MSFSVLGTDSAGNSITVEQSARREGTYIIGGTGRGKTVLLLNLILDDIRQGLGVCVLDPLGGLIKRVMECAPNRLQDMIYLDIANFDYPFGLNLYECPNPTDPLAVQYTVDRIMHIWERLFGISRQTPQMTDYMYNCAHPLIANPGYTMAEIPSLFYEKAFRNKLLLNVKDTNVHLFWQDYESMWARDRRNETRAIMNKLNEFMQPMVKHIVGQAKSTINLRKIMDERKILLVKLDPQLPGVTSLLGSIIVAQILIAAHSRSNIPESKRKQFNLYADEFDKFATLDFKEVYNTCRQFGVATTVAHQTRIHLLKDVPELARSVLQASTTLVFQATPPDSDEMAGKFDSTPPKPKQEEVGKRKKQTPVSNPIHWLLSGKTHTNPAVNMFISTWNIRKALLEPSNSNNILFLNTLNQLGYQVMMGATPDTLPISVEFLRALSSQDHIVTDPTSQVVGSLNYFVASLLSIIPTHMQQTMTISSLMMILQNKHWTMPAEKEHYKRFFLIPLQNVINCTSCDYPAKAPHIFNEVSKYLTTFYPYIQTNWLTIDQNLVTA